MSALALDGGFYDNSPNTPPSPVGFVKGIAGSGVIAVVGIGIAWAACAPVGGYNALAPLLCGVLAFVIQWVAFVPAYRLQTERFYDLTGSATYLTVTWLAVLLVGGSPRGFLLAGLVSVWALRLGAFLWRRVHADGGDHRFDHIKPDPGRFLIAWTLQGLWITLTLGAALAAIASSASPVASSLSLFDGIGAAIWLCGFSIEVAADAQKRAFKRDPSNKGRFIQTGLWAWSRHPNYFGEILLWVGVAVIAASTLSGWQWITLISPVFVAVLITRISGIPILEASADARWGHDPTYLTYKRNTPSLLPRPPRRPAS